MSKQLFTTVNMKRPASSTFDLTHDVKMSGKMGILLPCMAVDVLPGDKFKIGADAYVRMAPILAPIMHRVDVTIHYFFVPNRLLWPNWEKFITGTPDGNGDPHIAPYLRLDNTDVANYPALLKLADYLGITPPTATSNSDEEVTALPFSAYNLIYNEYYRDQNLIPELTYELGDGQANKADYGLRFRAWEHDYFTSCLPFAQKGTAVDIPLGDVELKDDWYTPAGPQPNFIDSAGNPTNVVGDPIVASPDWLGFQVNGAFPIAYDPAGSLTVQATTINDLRRAYRLQEWLEKNARGGTRYTEAIWSHFGVKSPDARLQRPEYITGVKSPIVISEVLNTTGPMEYFNSETGEPVQTGAPQGDMAGHGVGVTTGRIGRYYAQEHGWIIGILSIMPKTAYQQGINRMFTRKDFIDYGFPSFANLGEQEVLTREVYAYQGVSEDLFGYIPRYAEYKYMNSRVAGDFRTTLDYWHLGRIFGNTPTLSQDFIECRPEDVERIFAVQDDTDNIWMHVLNKVMVNRKLPFFGTPTI